MSQQYDPFKHNRRSMRWKGWDYGTPAYYFITICTTQRLHFFENHQFKEVAELAWQQLPNLPKSQHIMLDEWVIMPNHLHGIIGIFQQVQTDRENDVDSTFQNVASGKLGRVVGTYKGMVTRRINNLCQLKGTAVWQRGYWDRVIRNEGELYAIRQYIRDNPVRWAEDRENLDQLTSKMQYHPT